MGFRSREYELADLAARTADGRIQRPDFQNDDRSTDEEVRQLLVTVALGHPLGALLVLQAGNPRLELETLPIAGPVPGAVPELLVLDGERRLAALTQAVTGSGVVDTRDAGRRRYFLHVPTAVGRPEDLDEAVRSLPASGSDDSVDVSTRDLELELGYLPVGAVLGDDALSWLTTYGGGHETRTFIARVVSPMRAYAVPVIELDRHTTTEAVTRIFERFNRPGTRRTVFDLLTARFAGHRSYRQQFGRPFRLGDDWATVREQLDAHPVLDLFGSDDFVQAVTLVATHAAATATAARREDVLDLSLVDYLVWAPRVCDALLWAADFLGGQHLHTAADLPDARQLVPLAAIRTVLGEQTAAYDVHARLRQWFWCGVLGEQYAAGADARFALDLEQVPTWATGIATTVPDTVAAARFHEARLRVRDSAAYRGAHALLMGLDAMEWTYDESFDRAHYLRLKLAADQSDPALLGVDSDEPFFVARRAALRALVGEVMGKPVEES